jgi:hypothetical protein
VVLGPATAAADFAARYPDLLPHVRVVMMGVSVCAGVTMPWGTETPSAATNEKQDVPSANALVRNAKFTGFAQCLGQF